MTKDQGSPQELPWRRGLNVRAVIDAHVSWRTYINGVEGSIAQNDLASFATMAGMGNWPNTGLLHTWLDADKRYTPGILTKSTAVGDFQTVRIGYDRGLGSALPKPGVSPEIKTRIDGMWVPQKTSSENGQSFIVAKQGSADAEFAGFHPEVFPFIAGEDIAKNAQGKNSLLYPLVIGSFRPDVDSPIRNVFSGMPFIYLWDRQEGVLKLKRTFTNNPGEELQDPTSWIMTEGDDKEILTNYGAYRIPGVINETDWLGNMFFPRHFPWQQDMDGTISSSPGVIGKGFDYFGIEKVFNIQS